MKSPLENTAHALPRSVITQAIAWRIKLESGKAQEADCEAWRKTDPEHEMAWQRLDQMHDVFHSVAEKAPRLGHSTLSRADSERQRISRRRAIKIMTGSVLSVSLSSWLAHDHGLFQRINADLVTRAGERNQHRLDDNSRLWMNVDTAVQLRYTDRERLLSLRRGEIHLQSAPDHRPLQVAVPQGLLTALGTRFLVRRERDHALLQVVEGRVAIQPSRMGGVIEATAGQVYRLTEQDAEPLDGRTFDYSGWIDGVFSVRNMPLKDFLAELSRYRSGHLGCDARLDNFRISGVFQLRDTDLILRAVAASANAEVRYMTRWWASITPA